MRRYLAQIEQLVGDHGEVAIFVAILMVAILGLAALAVDIGFTLVTRNELQNASDSAALAAARKLGSIYEPMTYEQQQAYICDPSTIVLVAQQVALSNRAAREQIDVLIGRWDASTKTLNPTLNQPDAVSVAARRESTANSPVTTFFAKVFGIGTFSVRAKATGALTGESTAGPGRLPFPAGISKFWFSRPEYCNQFINFYPTGTSEGCTGWNTYAESQANAAELKIILQGLKNGTYQSPETIAGKTEFNFIGDTDTSAFDDIQALFDTMKVLNDGIVDADNDPTSWTTTVPVYDWPDCSNPNGPITIVGFATVKITQVLVTPQKTIIAKVLCNDVRPGRGGGEPYGTKGSIPGLVQ